MPILDEHTLDFFSHSPEQTQRFGMRLGPLLRPGDLLCLQGDLGTGKTCLVQGIGRGMGIDERITSPTFTLVGEYRPAPDPGAPVSAPPRRPGESLLGGDRRGSTAPGPALYHIDLYRLGAPVEEALAMGLDEYLQSEGVCVVEWAERIEPILPSERLWITLRHLEIYKRGITMHAAGGRHRELMRKFREAAFGR